MRVCVKEHTLLPPPLHHLLLLLLLRCRHHRHHLWPLSALHCHCHVDGQHVDKESR